MPRYFCPDHPKQVLLDTEKEYRRRAHRPEIWVPPEIVVCPIDDQTYFLRKCPNDGTEIKS